MLFNKTIPSLKVILLTSSLKNDCMLASGGRCSCWPSVDLPFNNDQDVTDHGIQIRKSRKLYVMSNMIVKNMQPLNCLNLGINHHVQYVDIKDGTDHKVQHDMTIVAQKCQNYQRCEFYNSGYVHGVNTEVPVILLIHFQKTCSLEVTVLAVSAPSTACLSISCVRL